MGNNYKSRRGHNFGRPWEDEEKHILTTWYQRLGIQGVQQKLRDAGYERTEKAVLAKAHALMLYKGELRGWTPVSHLVSSTSSGMYYRILFLACQAGVLKTLEAGTYRYLVPDEWADQYVGKKVA